MHRRALLLGLVLAGCFATNRICAAAPANPDEAKALVETAAAHFAAVGPDKAIVDFNDPAAMMRPPAISAASCLSWFMDPPARSSAPAASRS
jgi:hypothetical protein